MLYICCCSFVSSVPIAYVFIKRGDYHYLYSPLSIDYERYMCYLILNTGRTLPGVVLMVEVTKPLRTATLR